MQTDAFGLEMPSSRADYGRLALRTVLLDQAIAFPVAFAMATAGIPFLESLLYASIYSHTIGAGCASASVLLFPAIDRLPARFSLLAMMTQYFVAGAAGAEIARRLCGLAFGGSFDPGPPYLSWAIGATIALLVGAALTAVRRLRTRVVSTELEALQARVNPHFLFNTLNSIAALIREDPGRAEAMTLQLSALFRYTLTAPRRGLVTLEEELTIVEGYLAIEQERLGSRLTFAIDVDPALRAHRVPALTLQPLVENAVKHGVASAVAGGSVQVRGWREGGRVHVAVIDTGTGEASESGTGEGLESVRRRLRATFGSASSVTLNVGQGTTEARVTFPVPGAAA